MATRRQRQAVAVFLALALLLPTTLAVARAMDDAPADSTAQLERERVAEACDEATGVVAEAVHRYVDRFAGLTGFEDQAPAPPDGRRLAEQFRSVHTELLGNGCSLDQVREGLDRRLAAVQPRGPLARAVSGLVTSTALRVLGAEAPDVQKVEPGDDLAAVVAAAAPGSTVRLAAGRHTVASPLYLLRDVEIVGSGRERTQLVSTARGAAILLPQPARVRLSGLAVRHEGPRPASALVVWAGNVEATDLELSGATGRKQGDAAVSRGTGGSGLVLAERARVHLSDAVLEDNEVAGAVTGGRARLVASRVTFRDNGLCGLCVVDGARAELSGGELHGNTAGAYVAGNGVAVVRGSTAQSNWEAGIAVEGGGGATVVDTGVHGNGQVGILVDATSGAEVQVAGNALGGNSGADIVVNGAGAVAVRDNTCGSTTQLVLVGGSSPTLTGNRCTVARQPTG